MDVVLVGVDGSEASGVALEFAVEEATRRGAALRVVSAWELPVLPTPPVIVAPQAVDGHAEYAESIASEALARAKELQPDLACEQVVLLGYPGDILVEQGKDACLLVVGRRGHGGLTRLLMGSVSRHVADHAPCPVTIVPPLTAR